MPKRVVTRSGGLAFHVFNRAVRRMKIFATPADYDAFDRILAEAVRRTSAQLLAYCLMPNHWHLILGHNAEYLPPFMHWLTMTHAKRWHRAHGSDGTGPLYQNRYKAVAVTSEEHLLTVLRYVERNPVRAGIVAHAHEWRWGSAFRRCNSRNDVPLADWPISRPANWLEILDAPQSRAEVEAIRKRTPRGRPPLRHRV
jgi:putative transposase